MWGGRTAASRTQRLQNPNCELWLQRFIVNPRKLEHGFRMINAGIPYTRGQLCSNFLASTISGFRVWGLGAVPAPNGASPSPAFPRGPKNKTPWVVFFFALAPCRRPTGLLLPLPFAGAAAKKNTLGGVFFLLWPRAGTGLLLPLPFPGAGAKKNTLGDVFFALASPKGRGAQRSATKKNTLHTRGRQQKIF